MSLSKLFRAACCGGLAAALLLVMPSHTSASGLVYPGVDPGTSVLITNDHEIVISNCCIRAKWRLSEKGLESPLFGDLQTGNELRLPGDLFEIKLTDGTTCSSASLASDGANRVREMAAAPGASRLADRAACRIIEVPLRTADARLKIIWRALASDGANYIRQELEIIAAMTDCGIQSVTWARGLIPDAHTHGAVDGSVVTARSFFLACEDPHAQNQAGPAALVCQLRRNAMLKRGEKVKTGFVVGVTPTNQLRRAFLYYVERERAHPYRPYLHYNSWYDIAWSPFALNETNCLEAISLLGERFIKPHDVVLDGVVFDDGWDDPRSLWQFHKGFPQGFAPLARLCRNYNTKLGVWLSPFGGYGEPKQKRLQYGSGQGYETNATGFSLAGPRYYSAFKTACVRMIRDFGVNHFKFDGIATGMYASGGGQYLLDTEAMRRLMLELRQEDPDLYINLTTGSWPSPFWLRFADSLWRQGGDMGLAGQGPRQQQWLTYRDQETYRNIVLKGPLYPLNSLMSQGVAYSRQGTAGDPSFDSSGFRDDVRAFFGSGTGLQELYIQPGKLSSQDWQVLAEAAKWSRANSDVLVDTHWIGGDPGKAEVYGYASWTARKGILMLRNPDVQPHETTVDVGRAFELPPGAVKRYKLKSAWMDQATQPSLFASAGEQITIRLKPFEVVVLDATPSD